MAIIDGERTLKDVKTAYTTRGSFNTVMRKDAKWRFLKNGGKMICSECGINVVDICHKKPISDFDETAKIKEINAPENLVALCPTHHRIYDDKKSK